VAAMSKEDKNAIDQLSARFFEKSDDLIAVSAAIAAVIERRKHYRAVKEEQGHRCELALLRLGIFPRSLANRYVRAGL
jgi:hypothetical protein